MLSNSLILPHIKYSIIAWGYKGIRLLKIQKKKKLLRIITLSVYSTHSEPLFKQLNKLKIADQLRLQEQTFYFKYIHNNLLAYFLDCEFISNVNIHRHDTRTSSKIHTVRTQHELAKQCLKYNLITTYYKRYSCNSEKAYARVPRQEVWRCLREQGVPEKYVHLVKDTYEDAHKQVKTSIGLTAKITVKVGLHQWSSLSPYLFDMILVVMGRGTKEQPTGVCCLQTI